VKQQHITWLLSPDPPVVSGLVHASPCWKYGVCNCACTTRKKCGYMWQNAAFFGNLWYEKTLKSLKAFSVDCFTMHPFNTTGYQRVAGNGHKYRAHW